MLVCGFKCKEHKFKPQSSEYFFHNVFPHLAIINDDNKKRLVETIECITHLKYLQPSVYNVNKYAIRVDLKKHKEEYFVKNSLLHIIYKKTLPIGRDARQAPLDPTKIVGDFGCIRPAYAGADEESLVKNNSEFIVICNPNRTLEIYSPEELFSHQKFTDEHLVKNCLK